MSDAMGPEEGSVNVYDEPVVGLSFYTDDADDPIAGFGEQTRLPIPDVDETVAFVSEDSTTPTRPRRSAYSRYRVLDREFEYRTVEYDGFSGEGTAGDGHRRDRTRARVSFGVYEQL